MTGGRAAAGVDQLAGGVDRPTGRAEPAASAGESPTLLGAGAENSVAVTLGVIGDEWSLLILRYAQTGVLRYNDWLERLLISNAVLVSRLSRLTEYGLLTRVAYQTRPPRYEYRLTKRGRDTWPILLAIWSWELDWVREHAERLPRMRHGGCGEIFAPVLVCGVCRAPAGLRDVTGEFGPSGSWERSVPTATTRRRPRAPHEAGSRFPGYGGPGLFPQTMALIGNRWSAALLGAAFLGAHRFKEYEQRLAAPPTMVTDRLRTFCELGILEPAAGTERPGWPSYHLTAKGRAFFPVVMSAIEWGHRWFASPEGRALVYRHKVCGRAFAPRLACNRCDNLLRRAAVIVEPR